MKNNRRRFLGTMAAGAILASVRAADKAKPNVILIMADDMGMSDLGCYGGEIETPNIDSIARNGLRFTRFYSEPMCYPTRAGLLTGIYHHKSRTKDGKLVKECLSIAEAMKAGGYATYLSGKWHLGSDGPEYHGFDNNFTLIEGCSSFFAPHNLQRDGNDASHEYEKPDFYFTDAITDSAIDYINQTPKGKPFFAYVAYNAAHWPLHAKSADIEKYKGRYAMGWDKLREQRFNSMMKLGVIPKNSKLSPRDPEVPAWEDEEHKAWQQRRMEVYAAQIDCMDQNIGRLLETLKQRGQLDNTIVMFTIDNGACHVEYAPNRKGSFLNEKTRDGRPLRVGNLPDVMPGPEDTWQSYGRGWANTGDVPFRLYKKYAHEGGVHNAMVMQWPETIKVRNELTDAVAHMIDIPHTLMEVGGVSPPAGMPPMDGKSFLPVLQRAPPQPRGPL
ncbi:MAG: arylsulfatase, partial [Kiritimatiellales bacterium]|nr:arylsulfatase [Kiritimatiellales bacterium]